MRNKILGVLLGTAMLASVAAYAVTGGGTSTASTAGTGVTVVPGVVAPLPTTAATAGTPAAIWPGATPAVPAGTPASGFVFAVQSHFSQGWNPSWLDLTAQINARSLRDTVNWSAVERKPGTYDFSGAAVQTLDSFCARGGTLNLTIVPKNALYDGGKSVSSAQGQGAFAKYVTALAARYGNCLAAVEVGNEINGAGALDYPAGSDRFRTYVAMLRALYAPVKAVSPNVSVLGGSTNTIGTGFLASMFAAGMLDVVDGVAVHPYRPEAEGIDLEIAHLNDIMRQYGKPKPIWATEFSFGLADSRLDSAALVKSAVQLYAAGVTRATWYALVEQKTFPNMGLFAGLSMKPQALAYRTAVDRVLPYGRPQRISTGDAPLYLYRIGADRYVVWGDAGVVNFGGGAVSRDMFGTVLSGGGRVVVSPEPVIVEGAASYVVEDNTVVADTLLQWGTGPWSYWRRNKAGKNTALDWFDNDFTSFFGDIWSKPLRINNSSAAPSGDGANPMRAVLRYTVPRPMQVDVSGCFSKPKSGDGVDYLVERNGVAVAKGIFTDRAALSGLRLDLAAGDRVDISFGPNQTYGGDSLNYRVILSTAGSRAAPAC